MIHGLAAVDLKIPVNLNWPGASQRNDGGAISLQKERLIVARTQVIPGRVRAAVPLEGPHRAWYPTVAAVASFLASERLVRELLEFPTGCAHPHPQKRGWMSGQQVQVERHHR